MSSNTNWVYQYYSKLYPQSAQASTQSINSTPTQNNNQNLINLLFNHKIIIENLLENQNTLKTKVQKLINIQNNTPYDQQKYQTIQKKNNIIYGMINENNIKNHQQSNIFNMNIKKYQNNIISLNNFNSINQNNIQNQNNFIQNNNSHDNYIKQRQKQQNRIRNQVNYIIKPVHKKALIEIVSTCPDVQNQQNQQSSQMQLYNNSKNNNIKIYNNHNNNNHSNNNSNSHFNHSTKKQHNSNQNYKQNSSSNIHQQNQQQKHPKGCQTKNVIKNYGKSILTFIRKNRQLVSKISISQGFDQKQFFYQFQKFRGNVNSISQLKIFWTEKGNRFAKIFRIISNLYLKKHSIKHTFNSRVKNYALHIKYRKRLLDILKNPQDFTSLKYF